MKAKSNFYKLISIIIMLVIVSVNCPAQQNSIDHKVDSLLKLMSLDEKIGQMNQYNGDWLATGPITNDLIDKMQAIRMGKVGSMINIMGVKHTRAFQEAALQSRLKIPLLFGQDVIHGFSVTFPIPLAQAASWDMDAIEKSARIAATEAAASGIHWTFAPMVDITRDPRWGRVMEGAGEDPYLASLIARAQVKGFQGNGLGNTDAIMACAKHFAAYGAAIGGRDYNSVDMSLNTLWNFYLPPFKAAVDAGVSTIMTSLSDLNGVPATANKYLLKDVLKHQWNFNGFVVSDWGSIGEMIPHGYVKNKYEAAEAAMNAGCDMDMESKCYTEELSKLISDGKIPIENINDAVRRILRKKFEIGLFDDAFRFNDSLREAKTLDKPEFIRQARNMACKSIVLLKNEGRLLPLAGTFKTIALIGPLVKAKEAMKGYWAIDLGIRDNAVSVFEGMQKQAGETKLIYAKGCEIDDTSRTGFDEAVKAAKQSDVVIMALGERFDMSGEAKSRSNISLPGMQEELAKAIVATGKPVVILLMAGRPMVFNWIADHVPAIIYTWWLGTEAGNAIADVLYGNYNPSGKLTISFPRSEGQIPVYYNHLNTGRPAVKDTDVYYRSAYIDLKNSPRYAFGHGLSYTHFQYGELKLSKTVFHDDDSLIISFSLKNIGQFSGEEVVQLYLQDLFSQPVRPIQELKDFSKVLLKPGESKTIHFIIERSKLSFYNENQEYVIQPGEFKLMIGSASDDIRLQSTFSLIK